MKHYITPHEWKIREEGFHQEYNKISESIFSIGNGYFGQRGNFEESYTGRTLKGNYVAGVYYPDKTRVGWWKNGYPEYFAKVINAPDWTLIDVQVDGEILDLNTCTVKKFSRTLDMQRGVLERECELQLKNGAEIKISSCRFISLADKNTAAIKYSIESLTRDVKLTMIPRVNADVRNEDANYDEKFWNTIRQEIQDDQGYIITETKKTGFKVCTGMKVEVEKDGTTVTIAKREESGKIGFEAAIVCNKGSRVTLYKYIAVVSSRYYTSENIGTVAVDSLNASAQKGFDQLLQEHVAVWKQKWEECDIVIGGDVSAQQGIRFNIFQLYQTYTGEDERLNIGPKGFTGEKYGGVTYWDTEAFCFPFYLSTAGQHVARNLLMYRYRQLDKAIENAAKLGFSGGAALYPMVTMNGEECHNEWEITFEEIHRNGAIAYAIYNYTRYTGDTEYLTKYGIDVLIAISRFWAQRIHFSQEKQKYVMLGVTGPNEYENNVNNNWYTNTIAVWTLKYTMESLQDISAREKSAFDDVVKRTHFNTAHETELWKDIVAKMYLPFDEKKKIFLQQEGFLDKDIRPVSDIPQDQLPLNQHWSWDRILRSCYIKQADVVQGLYFFADSFSTEEQQRNFEFYEPLTVHESSLSASIHSVVASRIGKKEKAYALYLQAARLDLDDYNNDTEDGCHITSMAGSWLAIVQGFAGMHVHDGKLHFKPFLPEGWDSYSFNIRFRKNLLNVAVNKTTVSIINHSGDEIPMFMYGELHSVGSKKNLSIGIRS